MFDFFIVGKKDKDKFVIYDNREGMGGRGTVSTYTINQLVSLGYSICGVNVNNKGRIVDNSIVVVNLDGSPSLRISRCDDISDTMLQANTVVKGLKRSKSDIKKAKEIGQKRSASIQARKEEEKKKEKEKEIVDFYINFLGKEKGTRLTVQKICKLYNYGRPIQDEVYDFEMLFDKNGRPMPVYYSKSKDAFISKKGVDKKLKEMEDKCGLEAGLVKYRVMSGGTNRDIIAYVLRTTNKKILYTCGFKYRNPSTRDVPITNKQALEYLKNGLYDVTEYPDYIDFNGYTEMDMW